MKVTILMPVYNCEKFVLEAIDSILKQTYTDFEFLIIDDCSTDSSLRLISSVADRRIRILQNDTNIGLTKSLNKGIKVAQGEYIARMDADDVSLPNRLEKQIELLNNNPDIGFCGTWFRIYDTGQIISIPTEDEDIRIQLLRKNQFGHPTMMFRKAILEEYNLYYNESFTTSQDYDLWTRLIQKTKAANIPIPLVGYRIHAGQLTQAKTEKVNYFTGEIIKAYLFGLFRDKLSEEDLQLHSNVVSLELAQSIADVQLSYNWLNRLTSLNASSNKFNTTNFDHFIKNLRKDIALTYLVPQYFDSNSYTLVKLWE